MLSLLITVLILISPLQIATATTENRELRDMPVMVLYCNEDPGRIEVGGGKDPVPESLIESGLCTPAEGVSLTFVLVNADWDSEKDDPLENWDVTAESWFARCDMDADGRCALNSPLGFDIVLGVFLHDATIKPGYAPVDFRATTHNFTEFAGYGLALIPTDDPAAESADHQTLALNITQDDEPANVLAHWQAGGDEEATWLATNAEGWVSAIATPKQKVEIELVNLEEGATFTASCAANTDAAAKVQVDIDEHTLTIELPDTTSDVRCDLKIAS